jgi:glucosamine-6-phosphate deaminase
VPLPRIRVVDDAVAVATLGADIVERLITSEPSTVLALPTGRTPVLLYQELVRRSGAGKIDWRRVRTFNLDEWVGLSRDAPASYAHFMREHLFGQVNIPSSQTFIPNGTADELDAECRTYETAIDSAGGIDLAILGLGNNGHIGFNEPGTSFDSRTHVAVVADATREANAYSFPDRRPPTRAITVGVATIFRSRQILMIVTGSEKAAVLRRSLYGPVDESVPASVLQRHDKVTIIADAGAASWLPSHAYEGQPSGCA